MGRLYGLYRGMPLWAQHAAVSLLQSTERRRDLGSRLGKRVREIYSARRAIEQVCGNYDSVLRAKTRAAA